MRKLTAMVVASTLALSAANMVYAAETGAATPVKESATKMHHRMGGPHEMMYKNLNLTETQKQEVRDIMKAERDKMTPPSQDERKAMHDIVTSDSFDRSKAETLIDSGAAQNKARMLSMLETQNKIYNILTPTQKKQYNANFEKRMNHPRGASQNNAAAE